MVGEFTEKIKTYEQIAKANGVELTREDGEDSDKINKSNVDPQQQTKD